MPRLVHDLILPLPDLIPQLDISVDSLEGSQGAEAVPGPTEDQAVTRQNGLRSSSFYGVPNSNIWGVDPCTLLRNFGNLLAPQRDGHGDHDHAHIIARDGSLDYFISHNWSTRRADKFLALALYLNGPRAVAISIVTQLVAFSLVLGGAIPLLHTQPGQPVSIWCTVSGAIVFWTVVLFSHDLDTRLRLSRVSSFFDRVCIDQSSTIAKQEGIQNITTYLRHSKNLLVLLSDIYLEKIWTVFELTAYLALKPRAPLIVQPLHLSSIATCLSGILVFTKMMESFTGGTVYDHVKRQDVPVLGIAAAFGVTTVLRIWGKVFVLLEKKINNFSFDTAQCLHAEDREVIREVCSHIACSCGFVDASATVTEACKALELHARLIVPGAVHRSLSPALIPWRYAVMYYLMAFAQILDGLCAVIPTMQDAQAIDSLVAVLEVLVESLSMPVAVAIVGYFICYLPRSLASECIRLTVLTCIVLSIMMMSGGGAEQLISSSADRSSAMAALLFILLTLEVMTVTLFYLCRSCV